MSFAKLKKNRKGAIEALKGELEKLSKGNSYQDDRYWKLQRDPKTDIGEATIRFLPSYGDEPMPWVQLFEHSFQDVGGWYIERSRTTLKDANGRGLPDPVSEVNTELWNTGLEENQTLVRKRKRQLRYISNIYVVNDPANPQNNGKVFLFKYGKKIHDMITAEMNPEFSSKEPVNPFDFWEGKNLHLRCKKENKFITYDPSDWGAQERLLPTDKELEAVYNQMYSLEEEVAEDKFKSYEELKARFDKVVGNKFTAGKSAEKTEAVSVTEVVSDVSVEDDDEDESLDYFKKLATS